MVENWTIEPQESHVTGKTLLEAINAIVAPIRPIDKPLRIPLQAVHKIHGIGTVAVGRIETDMLRTNMIVNIAPLNLTAEVKSIEMYHKTRRSEWIIFSLMNIVFICRSSAR